MHDWGIDVESGILRERTWRWLQMRVFELVDPTSPRQPTRLRTALVNDRSEPDAP